MLRLSLIKVSQQFAQKTGCQNVSNCFQKIPHRNLYAQVTLGIDKYLESREKTKNQYVENVDKFRSKMFEFVEGTTTNLIFTEDLKNMVHIIENTPEDGKLLVQMLRKFNAQNKELRFGNFVFGPVVMRALHHLNNDTLALECFKDPEMEGFFDQLMSHQVLLDLLYEKKRYNDVLETFNIIRSRQIQGGKYGKHVVVLAFAACYKENTPESFKFATDLWKELGRVGHIPMRKATTFAAALAINQNAPHIALEILSSAKQQNYMTVRNLKAIALTDLGRCDDVLPILRSVLEIEDPTQQKHTFTEDVLSKVRVEIQKSNNKQLEQDFLRIEKFLIDQGHVSKNKMEDLLTSEIKSTSQSSMGRDRNVLAASFSKGNRQYRPREPFNRRQGLKDLY